MWSHASRFLRDLRRVGAWVVVLAGITFVIVVVLTYSLAFEVESRRSGVLSIRPPHEPLSFLRVVDPNVSIIWDGTEGSTLETPGMRALWSYLDTHPKVFVAFSLQFVTSDSRQFPTMANGGLVVVGKAPPFLDKQAPRDNEILLWGSIGKKAPGVDDGQVGQFPVRRQSVEPLRRQFVNGFGHVEHTQHQALLAMTPGTARELGVYFPFDATEVAKSLTCYCTPADLESVAQEMTAAEERAGTNRVYFAVAYSGLIGPVERSWAASETLGLAVPGGALISVCSFFLMAAALFWVRRSTAYRAEVMCGAGELGLQIRQQLLIAIGLTLPAVMGFAAIDFLLRVTDSAPPWPPLGGAGALSAAVFLQVVVGSATAIRVHRLFAVPR